MPLHGRQFICCSSVAWSGRGCQTSGAVIVRPSSKSTLNVSSVRCTSLTCSPGLISEVGIPLLPQFLLMFPLCGGAPARCATLIGMPRASRIIWCWAPVVVWLGVIALTSGEAGAHAHSDVWLWRAVHEWLPSLFGMEPPASAPSFLPWWVRKLAHVAEYAVLGLVVARAFLRSAMPVAGATVRPRLSRRPAGLLGLPAVVALVGLPFCVIVAILDELHQSTLASRTGSPRDVAIDAAGAALGVVIGLFAWRRRAGGRAVRRSSARLPRGG